VKLDLDADAVQMADGDLEISEACYRIVEQALLNSGVHGRATEVTIRLLRDEDAVDLDVDDNGVGLGSVSTPGLGTGVTDAWVSQLGGSWSRIAAESGGVRLTASLPLRSR
jgi:signal transduction histidine kinase